MSTITVNGDQVLTTYTPEEEAAMEAARSKPRPEVPDKKPPNGLEMLRRRGLIKSREGT